jgi:hypothetical protein
LQAIAKTYDFGAELATPVAEGARVGIGVVAMTEVMVMTPPPLSIELFGTFVVVGIAGGVIAEDDELLIIEGVDKEVGGAELGRVLGVKTLEEGGKALVVGGGGLEVTVVLQVSLISGLDGEKKTTNVGIERGGGTMGG